MVTTHNLLTNKSIIMFNFQKYTSPFYYIKFKDLEISIFSIPLFMNRQDERDSPKGLYLVQKRKGPKLSHPLSYIAEQVSFLLQAILASDMVEKLPCVSLTQYFFSAFVYLTSVVRK